MSRILTVASIQMPWGARADTLAATQELHFAAAEEWLTRAGEGGAKIAAIGETFNVLGLELTRESAAELARNAYADTLRRLGPIAKKYKMAIVAPVLATVDGVVRNVAIIFDERGEVAGRYFKVHCTENERAYGVVPGNEWPVFSVAGARIGVQICHDNSFPESARCLTINGAEIIFWPHVMSGWGGEFMDILLRSPAIHNGVYHVPVCFGTPRDRAWQPRMLIGRSSIIGPDATIVADAGRHPGIAFATLDLDAPRTATCFTRMGDFVWKVDMLNDRRPETYQTLTKAVTPQPPMEIK